MNVNVTPSILWSGEAAGTHWRLVLVSVYAGPTCWPGDDDVVVELVEGSYTIVWRLLLVSSDGTRIPVTWAPIERGLGGQLAGWSKVAIGKLKRHLIGLGVTDKPNWPGASCTGGEGGHQ